MDISIPIWDQFVHVLVLALDGLATLTGSAGLGIIAFTVIFKTLVMPLTVKALRSSKAMQELAPRIKELQKKHGNDRQRLSQETMALYQRYQVNPMAGCLPMVIQLPIFLGLYQAIYRLSSSGSGLWNEGFLWLPSLALPDPGIPIASWHIPILPFIAAFFQFVQTQMMRPANQPKTSDPQQAMMNTMMNFMPLTVIFFGWNFASGPVLYWATQSIYSVIQQWFITGWGRMSEWAPWLPELPEHRRLGYRPPRDLDEVVVVSGEEPVFAPGPGGWLQRKMHEAQKQAMERSGAQTSTEAASPDGAVEADVVAASAASSNGAARNRSKNARTKGKKGGKAAATSGAAAENRPNGASAPSAPSGAVIVPRKARPAPEGTRSEVV
jgi:YidC/Oxa1 family membrane protein insertase